MRLNELLSYDNGKLYWKARPANRVQIGDEAGHIDSEGYVRFKINHKTVKAHRVIWEMFHGEIPKDMEIDHINGIRDDNRVENLRLATKQQNQRNSGRGKGYSWYPRYNKWVVRISTDSGRKTIGYYEDEELAELVANEAREHYHGEFKRKTQ